MQIEWANTIADPILSVLNGDDLWRANIVPLFHFCRNIGIKKNGLPIAKAAHCRFECNKRGVSNDTILLVLPDPITFAMSGFDGCCARCSLLEKAAHTLSAFWVQFRSYS